MTDSFDTALRFEAAAEAARKTFKYFWRELSWDYRRVTPTLDIAIVKIAFKTTSTAPEAPAVESLWVAEVQFDGAEVTGTLINQPQWLEGIDAGVFVRVPLADVEDWLFAIDGEVYGAHTVQVHRATLPEDEREQHDQAWNGNFGEPTTVRLWPEERGPGLPSFDAHDAPEHPMSEAAGGRISNSLNANPDLPHRPDPGGWTLLQREALAGNLTPVRLLMAAGADPHAPNPNGHSAIELAQRAGWARIVEVLEGFTPSPSGRGQG